MAGLEARAWAASVLCFLLLLSAPAGLQAQSTAERQLREAVSMAQHGEGQQALARVNAVLTSYPDLVSALKIQGELLEDLGREPDAAVAYEHALRLAPNDAELLLKVGIYRLVSGKYESAIALLQRCLKAVPRDRDALYYLAQAYHFAGKNDLAVKTIAECVRVDPTNASALQKYGELLSSSGDNEGAMHWLLKAQKADPALQRLDFDLGVASYYNMDFPVALKYAGAAAERRPNDLEALALYAAVQVSLSQWQAAEETYARILAVKPEDKSALLGVGRCEVELKQYPQAVEALLQVERMDPTEILSHFYLSRAYAGLGKTEEARQEAELHSRMLAQQSVGPTNEDKKREQEVWARARELLEEHREDEARKVFANSATGPAATAGTPYALVGALYLSMGDASDAARNLKHALQIEPSVTGAHTYLGMLAMRQGDSGEAEREFKAELALHPNDRAAIAELGALRYKQGRWSEAAVRLASSETTDPAMLYMLCDSYFRLGRTRDAEVTAEALAAYARNEPVIVHGIAELAQRNGDDALAQRLSGEAK
ncbi:MAG: tetratricopeptide repeat protein [Acidobacteriaceae bacterium]